MERGKHKRIQRMREKIALKQGEKTLCLCMIVKNESKIIERCLDSVKSIINFVSIVDTGSTDNTAELVKGWCKKNDIPGTVHRETFVNFAHNRTHSAKMAHETYPQADYLLLIDADMLMVITPDFDKRLLVHDKYLLEQFTDTLKYMNVRLLSNKYVWKCVGRTHEYWDDPSGVEISSHDITTMKIDDRGDGGCKSDKFERDIRLLTAGIEDPNEPTNLKTRYKFYLAQSYSDFGDQDNAIRWYNERLKDGGWFEEVYYTMYRLGINYERKYSKTKHEFEQIGKEVAEKFGLDREGMVEQASKKLESGEISLQDLQSVIEETTKKERLEREVKSLFDETVKWYLKASEYRPERAEALYAVTKFYRTLRLNKEAYDLAIRGKRIPPPNDRLFIEKEVYSFLFLYEISIVAYYLPGKKSEGRDAIAEILGMQGVPEWIRQACVNNTKFYL